MVVSMSHSRQIFAGLLCCAAEVTALLDPGLNSWLDLWRSALTLAAINSPGTTACPKYYLGLIFRTLLLGVTGLLLASAPAWAVDPPGPVQRLQVGMAPIGITFDGESIWVANSLDNTVSKLRPSDGALLGTFPTGLDPAKMVFDGANIWVACFLSDEVLKFRASDGVIEGTFSTGGHPNGITFDGANIWIANNDDATLTKLRASDGALLGTFAVDRFPSDLTFDGENIWVSAIATVNKVRASDGVIVGTFTGIENPRGIVFDGANIWVAEYGGIQPKVTHNVVKLRQSDGAELGRFEVNSRPLVSSTMGAGSGWPAFRRARWIGCGSPMALGYPSTSISGRSS